MNVMLRPGAVIDVERAAHERGGEKLGKTVSYLIDLAIERGLLDELVEATPPEERPARFRR